MDFFNMGSASSSNNINRPQFHHPLHTQQEAGMSSREYYACISTIVLISSIALVLFIIYDKRLTELEKKEKDAKERVRLHEMFKEFHEDMLTRVQECVHLAMEEERRVPIVEGGVGGANAPLPNQQQQARRIP